MLAAVNPPPLEVLLGVLHKLAALWWPAIPIFATFALCLAIAYAIPPRDRNRRGWSIRRLLP